MEITSRHDNSCWLGHKATIQSNKISPKIFSKSVFSSIHVKLVWYNSVYRRFLSHLLIAGCDIGVQISVRAFVRPSTFTSKFGLLYISDR